MKVEPGLYERLIDSLLARQLADTSSEQLEILKDNVDDAESHIVISRYLRDAIEGVLRRARHLPRQIKLANRVMDLLRIETGDDGILHASLPQKAELLLGVIDRLGAGAIPEAAAYIPRPVTRLTQSVLFTGSRTDPTLASELKKEILSSDRIDILMSFIRMTGLRIILEELKTVSARGKTPIRVITTSYMGATEPTALLKLAALPNVEVRISYDTQRTRLHAKAMLFHRNTGYSTGYIGSSNLSSVAMTSGLEWNVKVTAEDNPDILRKFEGTFDTYWNEPEFVRFSADQEDRLRQAIREERRRRGIDTDSVSFSFDIRPYEFQREILDRLAAERAVHGKMRNLVVAATGTGKTVIAAFDYKRFREQNPGVANRLLFVAHREEILKQSRDCFRAVLGDWNFGELFVGAHRPGQSDHLFVSVQTLHSRKLHEALPADHFDFVVVDEFHHAEADTYRNFLGRITPRILLGLTATPERADGVNVADFFVGGSSAEIRLYEAIDRKLLSPFQYFGVSDSVDLSSVTWSRGRYDERELGNVYTGNHARAALVLKNLHEYIGDPLGMTALGFCVNVAHAQFMADVFTRFGIPALALSAESPKELRDSVRGRLVRREINVIFVVDLYNEGIDIPEVDTILFLRPTESLTVFLQQLGRGLRLKEGKECCTVLDFIGQAHKNYRFDQKLRAMMGRTHWPVKEEVEECFPHLPSGCVIQLEKQAQEHVLENIRQALKQRSKSSIVYKIRTFRHESSMELTLPNFLDWHGMSLRDIYGKGSWTRLCAEAGVTEPLTEPDEPLLAKGIQRILHGNSRRLLSAAMNVLADPSSLDGMLADGEDSRLLAMLHYDLWRDAGPALGIGSLKESVLRVKRNPRLEEELRGVLSILFDRIGFIDRSAGVPFPCPLDLHCHYTRDEILAGMGYFGIDRKPSQREGVLHLPESSADLFLVTLNKTTKDYSPTTMYEDYAISDRLFHWQSQSTTSEGSSTGRRYINHARTGNTILLFVRENRKLEDGLSAPYSFLGPIRYVSHTGSRPMSITWELEHPMPANLLEESRRFGVGG
jgi:superfamily II DNA or RNA helicase